MHRRECCMHEPRRVGRRDTRAGGGDANTLPPPTSRSRSRDHSIEVKVSGRERSQLECRTCVSDSESDSLVSGTLCRQVKSSIQLNPVKSSNKLKLGNGEVHGAREECKTCVFLAVSRGSRREAHGERTSPTFGGFFQSATLSCVETEDGEEEEAMIYKGASLLRAIGQLEGRIGKRGSSYKISQ